MIFKQLNYRAFKNRTAAKKEKDRENKKMKKFSVAFFLIVSTYSLLEWIEDYYRIKNNNKSENSSKPGFSGLKIPSFLIDKDNKLLKKK